MKGEFKRKVLKNGMTILFEKRDLPVVSVAFASRFGGINEALEEKGIAHFIEHALYKGTSKRNSKQIVDEIEKKGGVLNGFTGEEVTAIWCKIASKHFGLAFDVLSDIVKNPLFDSKELEKERKVIFEEIKMHRDSPRRYVLDKIHTFLYEEPFGIPLSGTFESLQSLDRKKIFEKFKEVYQPNNLILVVVGNATFEKIVALAEKNFGNQKGEVPELEIKPHNKSGTETRKGIDQANLVFGYHVPNAGDKKSYAAQVLHTLMAEGMSSRLHIEIREKRNLAYGVLGISEVSKSYAHNLVWVGATKESVEKVKKIILKEFKDVAKNLTEKELKQIKEQTIGNYHLSMEESQTQMVNLILHEVDGNAKTFYDFEKNIMDVKLKEVKELAKSASENFSFFALVPSD